MGRTDGDIMVFYLSANAIVFNNKTSDPWYNGTEVTVIPTYFIDQDGKVVDSINTTQYNQYGAASPLGCRSQAQYCNPNTPSGRVCAPLSSLDDAEPNAEPLFAGQDGALQRMQWFSLAMLQIEGLDKVPSVLGAQSLLARYSLTIDGVQGSMADNQWMLDLTHWLEINLAALQASVVAGATGPIGPGQVDIPYTKLNISHEAQICSNQVWSRRVGFVSQLQLMISIQKVLSTTHASFSVLGLSLTVGIGGLLIIVSYCLDPIMSHLQQRYKIKEYQALEWSSNGILQQQRLAHEGLGDGTWSGACDMVPVTEAGQLLARFDVRDTKHPTLRTILPERQSSDETKREGSEHAETQEIEHRVEETREIQADSGAQR